MQKRIIRLLRHGSHVRFVRHHHVEPADQVETAQVEVFPPQIARHEQMAVLGHQTGQRKADAGDHIVLRAQCLLLFDEHGVKLVEQRIGVGVVQVTRNPAFGHDTAIEVKHHIAIAIGIDLDADAAHTAARDA